MKSRMYMFCMLCSACLLASQALAEAVVYKVSMTLGIPRVYDNTQSMGCRKIQTQRISGYLYVDFDPKDGHDEPAICAFDFVNKTHKVSKVNVTYHDCESDEVMWRYIGNNKTGVFKNTCVRFSLDLNPSYNIGADEPDNTLIITLAGYGATYKTIRGKVTGQMGCGCMAYGHVSPTRTISGRVSDITPMCGTFIMRLSGVSLYCAMR